MAGLKDAEALMHWIASLSLPDNTHDFMSVSLHHPNEYAINEGRIISDTGLDISIHEFDVHFKEFQVSYSNALHCKLDNKTYLVGPLSRVNNNFGCLPSELKNLIAHIGLEFPNKNMYYSIHARAIEIYYAVLESIRILENYAVPEFSKVVIQPQAGVGYGCTEAPRGMLWQKYELDQQGAVKAVQIVPPTSQNQARIEEDLRYSLEKFGLDKNEKELRLYSETLIRNYDPCIYCSTHFLDLRINHL